VPTATPTPTQAPAVSAAEEGHKIFQQAGCSACHGDNAEGRIGPALAGFTRDLIIKQVRNGAEGMPAFPPDKLSDEDLDKIVEYIESLPVPEATFAGREEVEVAYFAFKLGDSEKAIDELKEAEEMAPDEATKDAIANVIDALEEGEEETAEHGLTTLLGIHPVVEALEALRMGDVEKAEAEMDEMVDTTTGDVREWAEDVLADIQKGELDEARVALERKADVHEFVEAFEALEQKDTDKALSELEEFLEAHKSNYMHTTLEGVIDQIKEGNLEAAMDTLKKLAGPGME